MVNNFKMEHGPFLQRDMWADASAEMEARGTQSSVPLPHTCWGVPCWGAPVPVRRHQGQLCIPARLERMEKPGKCERTGAEVFIAGENATLGPRHVPPATSTEFCSAEVSRMTFPRQTLESHFWAQANLLCKSKWQFSFLNTLQLKVNGYKQKVTPHSLRRDLSLWLWAMIFKNTVVKHWQHRTRLFSASDFCAKLLLRRKKRLSDNIHRGQWLLQISLCSNFTREWKIKSKV